MVSDWSPQKRLGPHCVPTRRIEVKPMRSKRKERSDTFAPGPPTVETNVVNINRDETLEPMSRADSDGDSKSDCVSLKNSIQMS